MEKMKIAKFTMALTVLSLMMTAIIVYSVGDSARITGNMKVDRVNGICYVNSGNSTDIPVKMANCGNNSKVILPCGVYSWNVNITLNHNQTLVGSGECTVLDRKNKGSYITAIYGADNIELGNFELANNGYDTVPIWFGNHSSYWDTGFHDNVKVYNIKSDGENCATKFITLSTYKTEIYGLDIDNYKSGIGINDHATQPTVVHYVKIHDNLLRGTGTYGSESEGIEVNTHNTDSKVTIHDNQIYDFGEQGIDANIKDGTINNNIIFMSPGYPDAAGIHVRSQGGNGVRQITLTGNTIQTYTDAIHLWDVNGAAVVGNVLECNLSVGSKGIYINPDNTDNINAIGNTVRNCSTGIYSNSSGINIVTAPNTYKECTVNASGLDFFSAMNYYGQHISNLATIRMPSMEKLAVAYNFNTENTNSSHALDSSPAYNDLAVTGVVTHGTSYGFANSGGYLFDQAGELRGPSLTGLNESEPFTILMMVKNNNWSYTSVYLANVAADGYRVTVDSDNQGRFIYGMYNGAAWIHKRSIQTYTDNSWHYIAVTHDGGTDYNMFVDFVNATGTVQAISAANQYFHIGSRTSQTSRLDGSVDNVWIFNRKLSYDEIKAIYEMRLEPSLPVNYRSTA